MKIFKTLVAVALLAFAAPAAALNPTAFSVLFSGGWWLPGASVDMNFAQSKYYGCDISCVSVSRASTGYAQTSSGLLVPFASGVARITDQGALFEEARTNLYAGSQGSFANATYWSQNSSVATDAAGTAPDATATASTITDSALNAAHNITSAGVAVVNTSIYTFSAYLKAGTRTFAQILASGSNFSGVGFVTVNLSTGATQTGGTVVGAGSTALANGWYRVWVTLTCTSSGNASMAVALANAIGDARNPAYVGSGQNILIWGAQGELGSFPTSYIPTTTASATRAADNVTIPGLNNLSQTGAVLLAWAGSPTNTNSAPSRQYGWDYTDTGNARLALRSADGTTAPNVVVGNGTSNTTISDQSALAANTNSGFVTAWNAAGTRISQNGRAVVSDPKVWAPSAQTFTIGRSLNSYVKRFAYFNADLSSSQMQQFSVPR